MLRSASFRYLLSIALLLSSQSLLWLRVANAASPIPGTFIENQATGSYVDDADGSTQTVTSDKVTLTVVEVAGITVTNSGTSGSTVTGGLAYFDFTLTNVGNDPTKFLIPNAPSTIVGGTQAGAIKVIAYDADGGGATAAVDLTSDNITVSQAGSGANTGTLLGSVATANNGSIPATGTIKIRVPITITGAGGSNIDVTMGDTPSNGQNQAYTVGNKDIYTVDNADNSAGETNGTPANGEREASNTQSLAIAVGSTANVPTITCKSDRKLFNTAYNGNGGYLTSGRDTYWDSAIGTATDSPPTTGWIDAYNVESAKPGVWTNSPYGGAAWISHFSNTDHVAAGNPTIDIYFRYQLNIDPVVDINSFQLAMDFFGDNSIADIFINGVSQKNNHSSVLPQPKNNTDPYYFKGYLGTNQAALTLTNNWQTGLNEIVVQVKSGIDKVGFIAESQPSYLCKSDGGDALATYGNAPHQIITSPKVYLGSVIPDSDPYTGQATTNADGDNTNSTNDEDGFTTLANVPISGTFKVKVPVHNTSGSNANLYAWIDFNKDGKFQVSEAQTVSVANNATEADLTWTAPSGTTVGNTYARFRLTTDTLTDNDTTTTDVDERSTLSANNGEVEDYKTTLTIASKPNLLLVKRITAVNNQTTTLNGDNLAVYQNDLNSPYDDNEITISSQPTSTDPPKDTNNWPNTIATTSSTFLIGGMNGGYIKPNDSIEYTIYFLSAGDAPAHKVKFCDRVPDNVTFIPTAFNGITHDTSGLSTADRGIAVNLSGTLKSYTNIADGDFARYYPPDGQDLPDSCKKLPTDPPPKNTNGAIIVNLGDLPNATVPGESGSYGFLRFRGLVK